MVKRDARRQRAWAVLVVPQLYMRCVAYLSGQGLEPPPGTWDLATIDLELPL